MESNDKHEPIIKNDIDFINNFESLNDMSFRRNFYSLDLNKLSVYQTIVGDDKLGKIMAKFMQLFLRTNYLYSFDRPLLEATFKYLASSAKNIALYNSIYVDMYNETICLLRYSINAITASSLLDHIQEDNVGIALRTYNLNNVYFSYCGKSRYHKCIHYQIKDIVIYDDVSLIPEIRSKLSNKLRIFSVNCAFTQELFEFLFRSYKLKSYSEQIYYHRFMIYKIIIDYGFIPSKFPDEYDYYLTNLLINKHPNLINNNMVDAIFANNDIFAINYIMHFYEKITIHNINKITAIYDVNEFIGILNSRKLIPNDQTLLLASSMCLTSLFNYCTEQHKLIPDQKCVLAVIQNNDNRFITIPFLNKILGHKILFTDTFFRSVINIMVDRNSRINFYYYFDLFVNHIPKISDIDILYAISRGVRIDNPANFGVICDEQLYFEYYKHKIPIDINIFKDNIDVKRLILRQKCKNKDKDVFKYMKDNDIKPDRYCSDSVPVSKRKRFWHCKDYVRTDVYFNDIGRCKIDYKFMAKVYDDFIL